MKMAIRSKLLKLFTLVLSVCMLFGTLGFISTTFAKAESTTNIATLVPGAAVRVTSAETSGIKFKARLNRAEYTELYNTYGGENGNVNAGMIIVPSDYIAKAGGYSLTKFADATLSVGMSNIEEFKEVTIGEVDYLEFTMSLINLKDNNYARDFEAIPYIEVTGANPGDNFEYYEATGKYYSYAVRNASNARNIYDVANKTLNDRVASQDEDHPYLVNNKYMSVDENGLPIVKSYVDGVADIKITNGVPTVANNSAYYTSPYTLSQDTATGDYLLTGGPKSLVVDGERQIDRHVKKGLTEIHTVKTYDATVNSDEISLAGRLLSGNCTFATVVPAAQNSNGGAMGMTNSYYAFDGKYGVGTAIDIYFTGNNMPEIMLFADKINGNMSGYNYYKGNTTNDAGTLNGGNLSGEKGFLISNGMAGNNTSYDINEYFTIWGPNRMSAGTDVSLANQLSVVNSESNPYRLATLLYGSKGGTGGLFTQEYISENYQDTEFKLVVTTSESSTGTLVITLKLYKKVDGVYSTFTDANSKLTTQTCDTKIAVTDIEPGSIILYGTVKGSEDPTVFTCSTPYGGDLVSNGTVAPDGTVTLNAGGAPANSAASILYGLNVPYLAFEGDYGIGTFVDFEFTGNNLPQVMFFANNINGKWSSYSSSYANNDTGDRGLLITNGIYVNAPNSSYASEHYNTNIYGGAWLSAVGPNRINNNTITMKNSDGTWRVMSDSTKMSYKSLAEASQDTAYIYKVGTILDETDSTIIVVAELYNKASGSIIDALNYDTGISNETLSSGNIIAYAGVKGSDVTTTFKAGHPYAGSPAGYAMSGATIANDGTITLAGNYLKSGNAQFFSVVPGALSSTNSVVGSEYSYFALAGEYGVGTYMDFYFTGNNMPEVMFFADKINGNMSGYNYYKGGTTNNAGTTNGGNASGEKGMLISNGLKASNDSYDIDDYFTVWGPNRMFVGEDVGLATQLNSTTYLDKTLAKYQAADDEYALLTQSKLASATYESTNFKYTVGTYELNGELWIQIILYTVDGESLTELFDYRANTNLSASSIEAGNIIIFDTMKGTDTIFKYSAPYESAPSVFTKGATVAEDGTITLTGTKFGAYNYMYGLATVDNNYYALNGKYGVGTFVDVYFTGNNMPEIMLFADKINGNMTGYDDYTYVAGSGDWTHYTLNNNKGLLFSNGFMSGTSALAPDFFVIWGMDRATIAADKIGASYRDATANALKRYIGTTAEALALSQTALASTYADKALKYTVGTYDNAGKLAIEVILTDVATGSVIIEIDFTTNILTADVEPGSIIFYDTIKGEGNNTVFKIGNVYE